MPIRENLVALALVTGMMFGQGSVQEIPQRPSPVPIRTTQPEYTATARAAKIEGAVLLQVEVDEKGVPTEAKVIRSLDKGLDQKAIETVLKWRFKPALKYGNPIPGRVQIIVNFRLL